MGQIVNQNNDPTHNTTNSLHTKAEAIIISQNEAKPTKQKINNISVRPVKTKESLYDAHIPGPSALLYRGWPE